MQSLWRANIGWDEKVSDNIIKPWLTIKDELQHINNLTIPRWIKFIPEHNIELHGYCDASEIGYAASVYVRNLSEKTVRLLIAKTKVAPIKEEKNADNITIPRLELCGALLLAQLVKKVMDAVDMKFNNICLWTDSKIVLGSLHANTKKYKKCIASRVFKINKLVNKNIWRHVSSENNAADCVV